jgi:predicted DNA-binding transcriptional regulator AlpA
MEKLWTVDEFREFLQISRPAVYHGIKRGTLPQPLRIGNRLRWHPREVEKWLGLRREDQPATPQAAPQRRRGPGRPRKEVQR